MRILILILLFMSAISAQTPKIEPGVSHELAKWRAVHYSDVRYKINLTLEKMSPVLKGTMEIRAVAREAAPIILDWRRIRGHEEKSTISNVSINGRVLSPGFSRPVSTTPPIQEGSLRKPPEGGTQNTFEESDEHLIFRDGVVAGENVINLDFTSPILPSGSAITRYVDKEDGSEYIYSLFVPSDASTAFPVFDQPDIKGRFTLTVNSLIDGTVVSNGIAGIETTGVITSPGSPRRYLGRAAFFSETKPISTYVFAFAAGPWQQVSVPPASAGGFESAKKSPSAHADGTDSRRNVGEPAHPGGNPTSTKGDENAERGTPNAESDAKPRNVKRELKEFYKASLNTDVSIPAMSEEELARFRGLDNGELSTSIYVRKSQATKLKPHAAEVFRLNREAVKYFEEYFDYKFPFPKYDLVLIPEFPFGGMEHAGTTFLREASIIFPQQPTKSDIASRATLIFHEASHQWFGDTVTMRWFDDLWLKEGFATFTAYKAMEKIMPEMNSWKIFYERIKQGAYQTDSTKGTTSIYQPIANLSAAKSAYGNIVYNKAPAFLRQAEFYLGEDKFRAAVRAFLKKHEFGNAEWMQLVKEFETASGKDLQDWAARWVTRRGVPAIRFSYVVGTRAKGDEIIYQQQTGLVEVVLREQNYQVLIFGKKGKRDIWPMQTSARSSIYQRHAMTELDGEALTKVSSNDVVFAFPNYQDYAYGIFLLDGESRDYVLKNIQNERDPFLRSMMWGALWDSVREGELNPKEYVELVLRVLSPALGRPDSLTSTPTSQSLVDKRPPEGTSTPTSQSLVDKRPPEGGTQNAPAEDESTTASILGGVSTAMTYYIAEKDRDAIAPRLESTLLEKMRTAPTLGQRITYYRAFLNIASTEKARSTLRDILNLKFQISDLKLKTKDRFDIVTRLLILGDPDGPKLLADLEKTETSDDAKRYAYAAKAGIPTPEYKAKYWSDFTANKDISESWIEAAFGPFNSVRHADLTLPYLERALKDLPNHKRNRKIFFVNGWLGAFIGGQRSAEALAIINKFLTDNPNLDRDLRLKILENIDIIERAVKIRTKYP